MKQEILKKIILKNFTNKIGLEIGLAIINTAHQRKQKIAVEVSRLNHTVFLYIDDTLPEDKINWLRRKANVAINFEESSLSTKLDLAGGDMSLINTFGLDEANYVAKGGAIPIFVENAGLIATVTVSGLKDTEDHQIIIDALTGKFI